MVYDRDRIIALLRQGQVDQLCAEIAEGLRRGAPAEDLLRDALAPGMTLLGEDFRHHRVYVPEVLIAARAMKQALELLAPGLTLAHVLPRGTLALGTVQGDLHDLGKTLVGIMAEGNGFQVVDLGVDVSARRFLEAAETRRPDLIGLSCLLTTTLDVMARTVALLKASGPATMRVVVGGAPVTRQYAEKIGADGYAADAAEAAVLFQSLVAGGPDRPPDGPSGAPGNNKTHSEKG